MTPPSAVPFPPITPTELATRFARLRPWSRNGERAVHKPLLALLLLGRIANG